jgi:hypothetical protein
VCFQMTTGQEQACRSRRPSSIGRGARFNDANRQGFAKHDLKPELGGGFLGKDEQEGCKDDDTGFTVVETESVLALHVDLLNVWELSSKHDGDMFSQLGGAVCICTVVIDWCNNEFSSVQLN